MWQIKRVYKLDRTGCPTTCLRRISSMGIALQPYEVNMKWYLQITFTILIRLAMFVLGQAQSLSALAALQQQTLSGNRSPIMHQGGVNNPLSRWFPPEIFSQAGSGQMPALPPMPNQKILSLEELERLHTSPMSH